MLEETNFMSKMNTRTSFIGLLLSRLNGPRRRNGKAFVTAVKEAQHLSAEEEADIFYSAQARSERSNRPMSNVEGSVDD